MLVSILLPKWQASDFSNQTSQWSVFSQNIAPLRCPDSLGWHNWLLFAPTDSLLMHWRMILVLEYVEVEGFFCQIQKLTTTCLPFSYIQLVLLSLRSIQNSRIRSWMNNYSFFSPISRTKEELCTRQRQQHIRNFPVSRRGETMSGVIAFSYFCLHVFWGCICLKAYTSSKTFCQPEIAPD